jgi:hypothetical protein
MKGKAIVSLFRFVPLFLLPLLATCTDQRATFEIEGSAHSLSLIRITDRPWTKKARYAVVASHMPNCMRRHALPEADLNAKVDVFSPGNNAWILRQDYSMYVVETRTCEGFAPLDAVPEDGLGPLMGTFQTHDGNLVFMPAPKDETPATP